ncbi:MAG: phosphate acyltransferase PlsX [Streptococcaceae bacterium]|jgi:glycerol-3-phosphate acyltransferase PlsX|nr:phosphate acyltransferase PlsX [Streptococcaceae bacterium]
MRIAVDAMGGDHAPQAIVEGVMKAQQNFPDLHFQFYGKEDDIRKYIKNETNITIVHTDEKINANDEPVKSIRTKKQASMILAARAVKEGYADAMFSAGNTGAMLAAGIFIVGCIKQIARPALMSTLPSVAGLANGFDMLDLGANAENDPQHLVQYAVMGSFYAKNVRRIQNPRVALLNNGTEESKGSMITKKTFEMLSQMDEIHFIGNVEACNILGGMADVVVIDGFTGNAVLKAIEGTATTMMNLVKEAIISQGVKGKLGALLLKDGLKSMKTKLDYSNAGGAVLFGLKAPVVKTHGSTGPKAVAKTIAQIHTMLKTDVVGQLVEHYSR